MQRALAPTTTTPYSGNPFNVPSCHSVELVGAGLTRDGLRRGFDGIAQLMENDRNDAALN